MQDPANMPVDVIFHDDEMKQELTVFQFQTKEDELGISDRGGGRGTYASETGSVSSWLGLGGGRESVTHRDLAAVAHAAHAAHGWCGRCGGGGGARHGACGHGAVVH